MRKAGAAAPPRTAPPPATKEKGVRNRSKTSGNARRAASGSSKSLRAKEEEYRKMNAELEAKTAELVKEAEHLVKGNMSLLCDLESSVEHSTSPVRSAKTQRDEIPVHNVSASKRSSTAADHAASFSLPSSPPPSLPIHTTNTNKPIAIAKKTKKPKKTAESLPSEVAVTTDSGTAADLNDVVLRMERELDGVEWNRDAGNGGIDVFRMERELDGVEWNRDAGNGGIDVFPEAADDMGPEALTRFLKAKLRVMQEEIDRLCQELTTKDKRLTEKEASMKSLLEDNSKLQRTQRTLQPELEKQRSVAEALRQKCGGLETQLATLRKEIDVMKGGEKKARSQQGAIEVRLNRALEDVERQKSELTSLRARSQDSSRAERSKVEELSSENKQLLRQRNELMTAFKKQLRLIDILKRQKMHIEAAKLLSFTEEEFVKALDWQTT